MFCFVYLHSNKVNQEIHLLAKKIRLLHCTKLIHFENTTMGQHHDSVLKHTFFNEQNECTKDAEPCT